MLHSILLLASFAVGVPELPRSAYADTEVSTNFPIAVEDDGKHWMTFAVSLVESPSNNVEVAVGTDADGNGALAVDGADWTFGYDCGRWFARKMENGEWNELRMESGEWKAESEGKGAFHLLPSTLNSGQRKFVLRSKGLDARWNLAKRVSARATRRFLFCRPFVLPPTGGAFATRHLAHTGSPKSGADYTIPRGICVRKLLTSSKSHPGAAFLPVMA